jgi:hypothetical protein
MCQALATSHDIHHLIPTSMQSAPTDREEPSGNPSSQYSRRPSHFDVADSALLRDAGSQPHGDSLPGPSVARDLAAMQNEAMDITAQLPSSQHIRHSAESQSSHHGMPSSLSAEHDQIAPNTGDNAIGNGPGPRGAGIRDPFPRTRFGLKQSKQKVHRCEWAKIGPSIVLTESSFHYP